MVRGYFQDTLNDSFRAKLRTEQRSVGFAFLDCNIASSYEPVFLFLDEFIRKDRAFVYMDEYFITPGVPEMFAAMCDRLYQSHRLKSYYVRNAGGFGALFSLMQEGAFSNGLRLKNDV
jgi:hypothetical protein